MALSQKHPGKILVPWFNSSEWKHVYHLIYSEDSTISDKRKAVEILQIWKIRMPILFAGLEGSLIILNAMLHDESKFSQDDLTSFYGLAIMRFLNLCAANSDQQGTFFRIAKERKLPEWLVSIRHDLAHSQKQSSLFMLQKGVEYCFQWLKREYWDLQNEEIKDFIINEATCENFHENLKIYCELIISTLNQKALSPQIINMLKEIKAQPYFNLTDLLKKLTNAQILTKPAIEEIPNLIIQHGYLFMITLNDDSLKIPKPYLEAWSPLIQYMYENDVLMKFIKKLHDIGTDSTNDKKNQEISSLWLNEIFESLLKHKGMRDQLFILEEEDCELDILNLHSTNEKFLLELKIFAEGAMETPHIYFRNYSVRLMVLCGYDEDFIENMDTLLSNYFELREKLTPLDDCPMTIGNINNIIKTDLTQLINDVPEETVPKKRFTRIEDTSIYQGCPIGVLPYQNRDSNPAINFLSNN